MRPQLGDALRDEEEDGEPTRTASDRALETLSAENAAPEPPHLCPGCAHAMVCGIATAILAAGGEGAVTISKCGAFVPEAALIAAEQTRRV